MGFVFTHTREAHDAQTLRWFVVVSEGVVVVEVRNDPTTSDAATLHKCGPQFSLSDGLEANGFDAVASAFVRLRHAVRSVGIRRVCDDAIDRAVGHVRHDLAAVA